MLFIFCGETIMELDFKEIGRSVVCAFANLQASKIRILVLAKAYCQCYNLRHI